ncbi:MAG: hypothetical protein ABFR31_08400 [Thermodesulfobacteriota bacterium]
MTSTQRKVAIITSLGKKYSGLIDIPNDTFRTTDLFNSSHIYWKDPSIKCYDDTILMYDVRLFVDNKAVYKNFDTIQIKRSEIIYFYDDKKEVGDKMEKKRASVYKEQTDENAQIINVITTQVANSFYDITGVFFGLFKKKSKDAFIPLTETNIIEVYRRDSKWFQKKIKLPHNFICISNRYTESVTLK